MNEQELAFQVYDLDAGTCEETFWRTVQYRPEDVDRLVQEWKDKGYRLVMDGYCFPPDARYHHTRFFTAKMYRMWAESEGTTSTPPDFGTRQFIWVTGGDGDITALVSDEPPTTGE